MDEEAPEEISQQDLVDAGLIGGAGAKDRREKLGTLLRLALQMVSSYINV